MTGDCHIHMILDGVYYRAAIDAQKDRPDETLIRSRLAAYRDAGVAYLRDGGDAWGVGRYAAKLAPEYGIEYRTPAFPIHRRGHYGGFIGCGFDTMAEYAALVQRAKCEGADFIKIMISGLMDFDHFGVLTEESLPADMIGQLIHIAHEEGMAVMAHANGASALSAAIAGVDSVEHGAYLTGETLHAMKENGTVWVPTLSTIGNLRGTGRFSETDVEKILESALLNVESYHKMGGILASGTDAGAWAVPHGSTTEEGYLAMAGVGEKALARGLSAIQAKF